MSDEENKPIDFEKTIPSLLMKNAVKITNNLIEISPSGFKMFAAACEEEILSHHKTLTDYGRKGIEELAQGKKTKCAMAVVRRALELSTNGKFNEVKTKDRNGIT